MRYLIGVDIGTSGTKTVLFDENGNKIRSKTVEYPMYQPKNGWAEQDPEDWYNAVYETLKDVSEGIDGICGIGLSGQMHGLVMLDKDGKVIRPSIIWCDQRTGKECDEITELVGKERLIEITADGNIDDDEIKDFVFIQQELERISITVETLQLWVERMLADGKINLEKYNEIKGKAEI